MEDAALCVRAGAEALGFVFYEKSPRTISMENARAIVRALPPFVTTVGVFVDGDINGVNRTIRDVGLDCAQLHGSELPQYCNAVEAKVIKAARVKDRSSLAGLERYRVAAFLLDTHREGREGGTGEVFDWTIAIEAKKYCPVILAGGLTAENVCEAIRTVSPYAVDVSSGVERAPGKKDKTKVERFIAAVRSVCK
jgi:phosphoribosylanthranilate isomerase